MRPLGVLLLLLICQLATSSPIFDRDGAGFPSQHRSAHFGETIRDWFHELKNRVVGKWNEWFGDDSPTPNFSPRDILNIDKTVESRIQGYPGLFLDLSSLSFDPKQDWGVRLGNWYIIRKVAGNAFNSDDDDSDEWDMRSLMPKLPSSFIPEIDWTPNIYECEIPKTTRSPTTTPKNEFTTVQQKPQTVTQTESSVLPSIGSTVTTSESGTVSIESTTSVVTISTESTMTSTVQIPTTSELVVTNDELSAVSIESMSTSTEPIATSTEPTVVSTASNEPFTESVTTFIGSTNAEPILPSTDSTVVTDTTIASESNVTSIEQIGTNVESSITSTELPLSVLNKRIEDNETIEKPTKKPKNRPISAEVIF